MSPLPNEDERKAALAKALADHERTYKPAAAKPSTAKPSTVKPAAGKVNEEKSKTLIDDTKAKIANDVPVQGIIPHIAAFGAAASEVTKKYLGWTVWPAKAAWWGMKGIGKGAAANWNKLAFSKDEYGLKHFNPKKLAFGLAAEALLGATMIAAAPGLYYHATLRDYDIFVPNAGVFVNQQFIHPSQPGHNVAPRDEIFTVLGQHLDKDNKVDSIRFDVDSNTWFFYKQNALRPDLLAAKMVPISPYGAMCHVEATGLYTRLPRFFRTNAVKWLDIRPEIVGVAGQCEQLKSVPQQYFQGNATSSQQVLQLQAPAPAPTSPSGQAPNISPSLTVK